MVAVSDRVLQRFLGRASCADRYLLRQPATLQGAVIQMLAHGVSAAALFILSGQLYERLHTRDMREMGGLWSKIAYLPAISLFFAAASLGLPGTGNFVDGIPDPDWLVCQLPLGHRDRHNRPGVWFGLLADHDSPCSLRPIQIGRCTGSVWMHVN